MVAAIAAAIASSVLTFLILLVTGQLGAPTSKNWPLDIAVFLSILLIWAPAFALVPAGILAVLVGRPLTRRLIDLRGGGFAMLLLGMIAGAGALWLLLRAVAVAIEPKAPFIDYPSLAVFAIIGLCSAVSWWILVILPGQRG
jgi:hypothetical protein